MGLADKTGAVVARYSYDAWGKVLSITDADGNEIDANRYAYHIAHLNPIRYRGYYYDTETGLYYLQSRYYDPTVGRFINADGVMGVTSDASTYNLFAYCGNNPVCRVDSLGDSWWSVVKACTAVVAAAAVVIAGAALVVAAAPVAATAAGVAVASSAAAAATTVGTVAAYSGLVAAEVAVMAATAEAVATPQAKAKAEEKTQTKAQSKGPGFFFGIDLRGKIWKEMTGPMSFSQAVNWVRDMDYKRTFGKNSVWGLYTLDARDAYNMAAYLRLGGNPIDDGLHGACGFNHYHTEGHTLLMVYTYNHFHIWYGPFLQAN